MFTHVIACVICCTTKKGKVSLLSYWVPVFITIPGTMSASDVFVVVERLESDHAGGAGGSTDQTYSVWLVPHTQICVKGSVFSPFWGGLHRMHVVVAIVQLLSHVQLFVTPGTIACQVLLSSTISWSLLKLMFTELVMLSNHLIFWSPLSFCFQSFPTLESFQTSWLFTSAGQNIGASASALVLPMNIWDWFSLLSTDLISLLYKELSKVFSSTTVWKRHFFGTKSSLWSFSHIHTGLLEKTETISKVKDSLQNGRK